MPPCRRGGQGTMPEALGRRYAVQPVATMCRMDVIRWYLANAFTAFYAGDGDPDDRRPPGTLAEGAGRGGEAVRASDPRRRTRARCGDAHRHDRSCGPPPNRPVRPVRRGNRRFGRHVRRGRHPVLRASGRARRRCPCSAPPSAARERSASLGSQRARWNQATAGALTRSRRGPFRVRWASVEEAFVVN